jgi:hypothetical protein
MTAVTSPVLSDLITNLLDHGHRLIPIDGHKVPLIKGWPTLASCDRSAVENWRRQWPYCGFGWALPAAIVVTDLDMKCGQNGIADFQHLDGRDPHEVVTPTSTSPTGGLHLAWAAGHRSFKNIRLVYTAIDIKTAGGFVGVPDVINGTGNGREWLRPPWSTPPLPAPAWLDQALKETPTRKSAATPDLPPSEYDEEFAREALARAVARIAFAPHGQQDDTRHRECFFIGSLVKQGVLDRNEALAALKRAALAMPTYGRPWSRLEERVEKSLAAGEFAP